jgi:hypothetical protein
MHERLEKQTVTNKTMEQKTLEQEIAEVKEKMNKEIDHLIFRDLASKELGIDKSDVIIYGSGEVGFFWSTKKATVEDLKRIVEKHPISRDPKHNYQMTFAGANPFFTDSPLVVKWTNAGLYSKDFRIHYVSSAGIKIQIGIPENFFKSHFHSESINGKHLGFGRYESLKNARIELFKTQRYSGGSNVLYFKPDDVESRNTVESGFVEEYENYVLTGTFKSIS